MKEIVCPLDQYESLIPGFQTPIFCREWQGEGEEKSVNIYGEILQT